jgi:DUF4097 and DUF4098 domain-containing protein YvlB
MSKPIDQGHNWADAARGFGAFLRSLLHGIPWSESVRAECTLKLSPPKMPHMTIHNANGRTRVIGQERDNIEIFVEKRARGATVEVANELLDEIEVLCDELTGGLEVEVNAPSSWKRHGSANLLVHVPRDLGVAVIAANGRVGMEGLRSSAHARSSNGPVTISDIIGDVEVFTSNAKVSCSVTCGRLKARSSNSKILVEQHSGSLDASTSNGVIHAVLSEIGSGGVVLATSNGRIVLELPEDVDGDVDVRVENGVIRNSLNIEHAAPDKRTGRLKGRLGRGGIPIKLRTSNGTISLR